jgi:hypothetical protein
MDYYVIDLDGPNYPFLRNLAIVVSNIMDVPLSQLSHVQDEWSAFQSNWNITNEQFCVMYALGVKNGHLLWEGDPVNGSIQGWTDLTTRQDSYIHVVTDRNPFGVVKEAHEATHYWLATHGLFFDEISFTGLKADAVLDAIAEYTSHNGVAADDVNVFTIDDKPEHCIAFAEAGFHSFVYDEPSNRHVDLPRVSSMIDFAQVTREFDRAIMDV